MEDEKAKSKSVTLLPKLWEQVEEHVEKNYRGNRSSYFQDLIEADLNKSKVVEFPSKENENFFVELCDMLAGSTVTDRARKAFRELEGRKVNKVNQRHFLEHILERASIAAAVLVDHPEAKYDGFRFHHNNKYSKSYDPESYKSSSKFLDAKSFETSRSVS